jgi:hypothetical protein
MRQSFIGSSDAMLNVVPRSLTPGSYIVTVRHSDKRMSRVMVVVP